MDSRRLDRVRRCSRAGGQLHPLPTTSRGPVATVARPLRQAVVASERRSCANHGVRASGLCPFGPGYRPPNMPRKEQRMAGETKPSDDTRADH